MAEDTGRRQLSEEELQDLVASSDSGGRTPTNKYALQLILWTAFGWSLFQIWYASPLPFVSGLLIVNDAQARALHLGFAVVLAYLAFPAFNHPSDRRPTITGVIFFLLPVIMGLLIVTKSEVTINYVGVAVAAGLFGFLIVRGSAARDHVPYSDWIFAIVGALCATYRFWFYEGLADRAGRPIELDIFVAVVGLILLLEAARRSLGPPMMVVALVFLGYTFFGDANFIPDLIRYQGASVNRGMDQFWLSDQGVFGIALGVSTRFVFLFVLFGALLDRAGAGNYFIKLAFALLGHLRGGPAKAAVVASGMTGLISGSSIANVVTTGTFTMPLMKRVGFTSEKAGAVEVASSVNGQIMPPVMGAAAFLMVEYVGIPYTEVVQHAFLPAIISYIALVYIVHLEAVKNNMPALEKPGERLETKWAFLSFGITVCSILIIAGAIYYLFELAGLLTDSGLWLLATVLILAAQAVYFAVLGGRLPRDRVRRTISIGGIILMNLVLVSIFAFFAMTFLKELVGDVAAAWIAAAVLVAVYVALLAYGARFPELELDDPNAPVIKLPEVGPTVKTGLYFFLPIIVLVWNLMIERLSPGLSAFWAVMFLLLILLTQRPLKVLFRESDTSAAGLIAMLIASVINGAIVLINNAIVTALAVGAVILLHYVEPAGFGPQGLAVMRIIIVVIAFAAFIFRDKLRLNLLGYIQMAPKLEGAGKAGLVDFFDAMIAGARNMIGIGIATAVAGIIVGTVTLTGIGNTLSLLIEQLSGGNLILMLVLVAILSLILGMGLPTTANYIVVSALMAPVIVEVGTANGLVVPLIAVHLFVFYFGIMADVTPPVGLASFAAAAVSGGDPLKTGFTAFFYSLRTVALPFIFIFNTQLILYDLGGPIDVILTIAGSTIAMLVFAAATQGYFFARSRIYETLLLLLIAFTLFRPGYWMDMVFPPTEVRPGTAIYERIEEIPPGGSLQMRAVGEDIVTGDPVDRVVVLPLPEGETPEQRLEQAGVVLREEEDGLFVDLVVFGSQAQDLGLDFDYQITEVIVAADVPPKELVWIPALILLGGIIVLQRRRARETGAGSAGSSPAAANA
jgi:TRAP transporter 4TM/12TM fusion protein